MFFGRKRRAARGVDVESPESPPEIDDVSDPDEAEPPKDSTQSSHEQDDGIDESAAEEADDDKAEYREDGPFDYDEVDFEADDVERLDFGSLIITPIDGMELQLQVEEQSQTIQSALVVFEGSGIEVALFAAPRDGGLVDEVLDELVSNTTDAGGIAHVDTGPFGPEVYRELKMTSPEGQQLTHRSRMWLVEGPRWMLRAVLMGAAVDEGTSGRRIMEDYFRNLVVRRGDEPKAPGDLITLTIPKNLASQ